MTDLTRDQRRTLETAIKAARDEAEIAAADALRKLGVADAEAPAHLDAAKRAQRNRLRAHARALGDVRAGNGTQAITRLTEQSAYVQWHRLLFARFLVERKLLREETGATVSLNDCREIAFGEGAGADEWSVAAGFAAAMLPGVFPADDPAESLVLAPEQARTLRQRLLGIHPAIFLADDSLGWTYQFWRAAEKQAVNDSQVRIGAAELPAVTQLFTEPYMVRFLLHNTLGAWWAGKRLAADPALRRGAADEAALRAACALPGYAWEYLRFVQEDGIWRPAAGAFPGWPAEAKALTVLDPCCGSGHFMTEALAALAALRVAEEGLSPGEAVASVLRDNLAGLEIDGRCVQIAAFNLSLTGWRIGGPGTALPTPNVAWVGAPPPLPKAEFAALANRDAELQRGLEALYDLFRDAPLLGSLIEPIGGDLADPRRVARIEGSIAALVETMRGAEAELAEGAVAARGMADAVSILARRWTLQATNVPFLGRAKQDQRLSRYIEVGMADAKPDLATAMLKRMQRLAAEKGTVAAVSGQNWWYLGTYKDFRGNLLGDCTINILAQLGDKSFQTPMYSFNIGLSIFTKLPPPADNTISGCDVSIASDPDAKSKLLECCEISRVLQSAQTKHPDHVIGVVKTLEGDFLSRFAACYQGTSTGDNDRCVQYFWEQSTLNFNVWQYFSGPPTGRCLFDGMECIVNWKAVEGPHTASAIRGDRAWGKRGIIFGQMQNLPSCLYVGTKFSNSSPVLIANEESDLPAILAFVNSGEFLKALRAVNRKVSIDNGYVTKVPIDMQHWRDVAERSSGNVLPEPHSDDPTQSLFHGHPRYAEQGTELHVALARLTGYRWPAEGDTTMRLSTQARERIADAATLPAADADGLLPLSPLLGERGLADRLRTWCAAAWGKAWTADTEAALITAACERAKDRAPRSLTLDAWLRTHAARQHSKLFHDRPFLWWITDGRADGFMAVVHYHRLTRDALSRLAFHVLGDHLARLGEDPRAEAARILQKKLEQIIEGEAPLDIFVRWKPAHEQPLGWDPDLNDGVRLNIRPFIEADVLAHVPNGVHYRTDRGKDVPSAPWYGVFHGERRNDHHTTLGEKRAARTAAETRAARAAKR